MMSKLERLLSDEEEIDLKLSYSRISDFDRNGPKALVKRILVDGEGLRFGSLTDDMLVDRLTGSTIFKENYVLYDDNKPKAMLGQLADIIIENYDTIPDVQTMLKIVKHNEFWSNVKKEDVLLGKFDVPELHNYLKIRFETKNKLVVDQKDYDDALDCVNTLLNHKHTSHLFNNNFENHYQFPFSFEYKNFTLRGLIDKLSIDHDTKMVYIEDIKTGSSKACEFTKSFLKYRYDFQECVYTLAFGEICRLLKLENYTLAPFKFIFIGRFEKVPHVFEISEKWHNAALRGFKTISGYKYKGLDENLDLIYYHWKNKRYEFDKEIYENNGNVILNDDFIEVN
ncbi:MAG TPA: hypothetical protein VF680_17210 [Allosphingosinicella sp.]